MSIYTATIRWSRTGDGDFTKGQYSRGHEWSFDGGVVVPAGPSPHIVPEPWGNPAGVDPEEAFIASLSSCHMLFFVDFARRAGFTLDDYLDEAEGAMEKNAAGKMAMTVVTLRPRLEEAHFFDAQTIFRLYFDAYILFRWFHLERINSNVCELYALEVCRGRTIGSELQRVPKYDQTASKLLEEPLGRQIIY